MVNLSDKHEDLILHAAAIQDHKTELDQKVSAFEAKKKELVKEIIDAIAELLKLLKAVKKTK